MVSDTVTDVRTVRTSCQLSDDMVYRSLSCPLGTSASVGRFAGARCSQSVPHSDPGEPS